MDKVLIANRGEIASRIIRTCKRLKINTVAVYSEADASLPYVAEADEGYLIGPPPVQQSYLNMDKIIEIAKKSNVDAIHPGYGFLSESYEFAKRCQEEGFIFIGPQAEAIKHMGDKVHARQIMQEHAIPVIPGSDGAIKDLASARAIAQDIGYPLMLKAAAGGGGVGMQRVNNEEELEKQFIDLSKRAKMYFGNGDLFLEKMIDQARHIEVQLAGDQHGNYLHFFERECSIQRRHQKVVEEAGAVNLSKETKKDMYQAALRAAQAIHYESIGTVEFLVDSEENFYFLEMNTRIQVEHPVTEEVTGVDFVEMQLDIARGSAFSIKQSDITAKGHAIELRLYAEDPETFFPSPGQVTRLHIPKIEGLRHELTIDGHTRVTPYYDPMIGKLIAHGKDREASIQILQETLDKYIIEGIKTNIPLLKTVLDDQRFQEGQLTINFLETLKQ